ncbi:hypothetical protein [Streptomyces sp. NPDC058614]|uniref:hypothetical protein n=1 Tax=Streptomyces sp. NPDC058614 TaxID=3346557 RepID=UPI00365519FE
MPDPVELGARAAAQRLATPHTPALTTDVEVALHARGTTTTRPDQYLDPISLGALIVSIATLTWTVYKDLRKSTPTPQPDAVTRRVRVRLDQLDTPEGSLSPADRDRCIDITIEETLNSVEADDPEQG